jgi:hypothetical protein
VRSPTTDMALENLQCAPLIAPGQTVPVTVNAVNLGDSPVSCTVTVRDATDQITIGTQVLQDLAAHSTHPLSFSWNTTGRASGYHSIIAAASTVTGETDLENNTNQLTIALSDDTVQNTLIASGSEWKYNDLGRDLHLSRWNTKDYYESEWKSGTGPLGYGGDGEVTVLSYGIDSNNKYPTYYFRKSFVAPAVPVSVALTVRRDDGVVVYLNGTEVARANMPAGPPEYQTLASSTESGSGETTYHAYTIVDPTLIQPGMNILAAEVHQASLSSSDVGFDAQLVATLPNVPHTHDIALVKFAVDSAVLSGDRVQLLMRVTNNGTALESFSINVTDLTESAPAGSVAVENLVPGETRDVSLDWETFDDTNTTHSLEAVAGPVSEEIQTTDNSLTAQLTVQSSSFGSPGKQPGGSVGGYCSAVAVNNKIAYVGEGASVSVIDLENPAQPVLYGRVQLPGIVLAIAADDDWIYAACGSRGVFIIDADDPTALRVAKVLDTSGNACGLAISGSYLFIADGVSGVRIVDISDPDNAVQAGAYHTEGPVQAVALKGDILYALDGHNGLMILNAASKTAPVLLGVCDRVALGTAMAVDGSHVYVVDGEGVLSGVDVSTPSAPVVSSRVYLPGPALSIAADESALFIPAGAAGLVIADISSPPATIVSNTWPTSSDAVAIAVDDSRAYLAEGFAGLRILNVSSTFNPTSLGLVGDGTRARGSAVSQGILYLASGNGGVKMYSVTNATLPELLGIYTNSLNAVSVAAAGDTLYVADGQHGLQIAAVSTPADPVHQATYTSPNLGVVRAVAVHGSSVVISDGYRIELVNVSTPGSPQLRSSFSTNVFIQEIAMSPSNIYAAVGGHGVLSFSYTSAGTMTYTGTIDTPGNAAMGVALSGARIYIADDAAGWHLADASQVVQTKQVHLPVKGVATDGSRLHVLDAQHGLHSYDITLRLSPVPRDVLEPLAHAMQITAKNKFVYVAQDAAGAAIINTAPDDVDFDGMPDSFEQAIIDANSGDSLTTLAHVLPGDDFDSDFLSNFAEFVAGTDPVDPLSVFAVQSTHVNLTGTFFLRWSSVSNRSYAVYRSDNPANGFTAVQTGIPATPPVNLYTTTDNTTNAYYTIIIE